MHCCSHSNPRLPCVSSEQRVSSSSRSDRRQSYFAAAKGLHEADRGAMSFRAAPATSDPSWLPIVSPCLSSDAAIARHQLLRSLSAARAFSAVTPAPALRTFTYAPHSSSFDSPAARLDLDPGRPRSARSRPSCREGGPARCRRGSTRPYRRKEGGAALPRSRRRCRARSQIGARPRQIKGQGSHRHAQGGVSKSAVQLIRRSASCSTEPGRQHRRSRSFVDSHLLATPDLCIVSSLLKTCVSRAACSPNFASRPVADTSISPCSHHNLLLHRLHHSLLSFAARCLSVSGPTCILARRGGRPSYCDFR